MSRAESAEKSLAAEGTIRTAAVPPSSGTHRLELLDYGRFVAAFAVLLSHYFSSGFVSQKLIGVERVGWLASLTRHGTLGVSFFFMISGYVIFFSALGRSARSFGVSRLVRLFPAYWFAVLFTAAFGHLIGDGAMRVSASTVLANLTMVPQLFGKPFVDGVYWTLQYELIFYGAVLLVLLLGLAGRLRTIFLWWPVALLGARLAGLAALPLLQPVYAFFALGALFAIARSAWSVRVGLSLGVAAVLCLDNATGVLSTSLRHRPLLDSAILNGVAVLVFCAVFALVNSRYSARLKLPYSDLLGRLTYPLYLVHAHWGFMMLNMTFKWLGFAAHGVVIALALSVAWLINRLVERRYRVAWQAMFDSSIGAGVARASHLIGRERVVPALPD